MVRVRFFTDPTYITVVIVLKDDSAKSIYDLNVGQVSVEMNAHEHQNVLCDNS